MADIQNLKDLRAAIRPLGYGIKTKRLSWGPHATFFLLADESHALTYDVFTPELLRLWTPLFDFLREHSEAIGRIRKPCDGRGVCRLGWRARRADRRLKSLQRAGLRLRGLHGQAAPYGADVH